MKIRCPGTGCDRLVDIPEEEVMCRCGQWIQWWSSIEVVEMPDGGFDLRKLTQDELRRAGLMRDVDAKAYFFEIWNTLKGEPEDTSDGVVAIARVAEMIARLKDENAALRKQVEGHCARIAAQSELLSRRAEDATLKKQVAELEKVVAEGCPLCNARGNDSFPG